MLLKKHPNVFAGLEKNIYSYFAQQEEGEPRLMVQQDVFPIP